MSKRSTVTIVTGSTRPFAKPGGRIIDNRTGETWEIERVASTPGKDKCQMRKLTKREPLFEVVVIEDATRKTVKRLKPAPLKLAEKVFNGLWRQLDHERFTAKIVRYRQRKTK